MGHARRVRSRRRGRTDEPQGRRAGGPRLSLRRTTVAAAFALALAQGGCGNGLDRDQARVCRLAAVALVDDGTIAIRGQRLVSSDPPDPDATALVPDGGAVRIDTLILSGPSAGQERSFECLFGAGPERETLAAVRMQGGWLPLPAVFALDRFWIGTPDAASSDPLPVDGADEVPLLPPHTGYALQQAINAIPSAAVYALLAVAYALVYGLIGRINLAFGAFAAIGGTATLIAVLGTGAWGAGVALAVGLLAALVPPSAYGIATARLVFAPLHRASGQQALVATIGLALVLGESLRLTQGAQARWIGPLLDTPFALAREAGFVVTVTPIAALVAALALVTSAGLALAMRFSAFGRNWRAYRDDPGAAALFGIGRDRIMAQTFAVASGFAGLAGGITVVFFGDISFAYAQVLGLKALTAAVLGGIGSVSGAFLGGLVIGIVEATWSSAFPIVHRDLVTFCILIATLIWRPGGFFGERDLVPRRV